MKYAVLIILSIFVLGCTSQTPTDKFYDEWSMYKIINITDNNFFLDSNVCRNDIMIKLDFIVYDVDDVNKNETCGWLLNTLGNRWRGWIIGIERNETEYYVYIAIGNGNSFNYLYSGEIELNKHYEATFKITATNISIMLNDDYRAANIPEPMLCYDDMPNITIGSKYMTNNHQTSFFLGKITIGDI